MNRCRIQCGAIQAQANGAEGRASGRAASVIQGRASLSIDRQQSELGAYYNWRTGSRAVGELTEWSQRLQKEAGDNQFCDLAPVAMHCEVYPHASVFAFSVRRCSSSSTRKLIKFITLQKGLGLISIKMAVDFKFVSMRDPAELLWKQEDAGVWLRSDWYAGDWAGDLGIKPAMRRFTRVRFRQPYQCRCRICLQTGALVPNAKVEGKGRAACETHPLK